MRTQHQAHKSNSVKPAFNPHFVSAGPARVNLQQFKIVKKHECFRLNQVVYQYQGPTHGIEGPGEVPVTVSPNQGPFVGLTSEYLERVLG